MANREKTSEFPLADEYKKKTLISPSDVGKLRDWMDSQPHLPADHITGFDREVINVKITEYLRAKAKSQMRLKEAKYAKWMNVIYVYPDENKESQYVLDLCYLDLILTYHCCNRSSGVTKEVLDLNFTLKTLFTNFFKDRVVDDKLINTLHTVLLLPLESRAHDSSTVVYCRLLDYDYKNFVFHEAIRAVFMVLDLWQYNQGTWPGFVIMIDLDRMSMGHLTKLDLQTIQQFLYFLQEAMLVKLKGLHFLNAPSFMDKLMMLLKPFLKKELLDMLHIHQIGAKTVEKFVPMTALPKEAGGEFKTFDQSRDEIIAWVKANKAFYKSENNKRVTESKRPGKPKTISDIFGGIEGSFKKLDID